MPSAAAPGRGRWRAAPQHQQQRQQQRQRQQVVLAVLLLGGVLLLSPQLRGGLTHGLATQRRAAAATAARQAQHAEDGCAKAAAELARGVLGACPGFPGFCPRQQQQQQQQQQYLPGGPTYPPLAQQARCVAAFVAGDGLAARRAELARLPERRGILVSAGKPHHVGNAAIILHVLRRHLGCTLPVEIAHRGDDEIDAVSRATLSAAFQPLHFLDLNKRPVPAHHNQDVTFDRYEPKIYALYHSRFQQVLLLDADNLPLRDPTHLFSAPHVARHGVMMWLDLWSPQLSSTTFVGHDSVYRLLGLNKTLFWDELSAGQGAMQRVAESGQLVFDRVRHADVLEHLWLLTSFSSELYKHVLGDKDTFGFAFALARKLHDVHAVAVPPAAAFVLKKGRDSRGASAGQAHVSSSWRFNAMVQYDHLGHPAFFHRTFAKWHDVVREPLPMMDVVSGPLPNSFIQRHLGNRTVALTPDLPGGVLLPARARACAPAARTASSSTSSSSSTTLPPAPGGAAAAAGAGCPGAAFRQYQQLRAWGLPVERQAQLEQACRAVAGQQQQQQPVLHSGAGGAQLPHVWGPVVGPEAPSSSAHAGTSSSSCPVERVWPHLSEGVWLDACKQQQQLGLPAVCEAVAWPVARYVLPPYADAVAAAAAAADAPPPVLQQLPVLDLRQQPDTGADAAAAAAAACAGAGPGLASPSWSRLELLQREAIPAAVRWVVAHLSDLPLLNGTKAAPFATAG